MASYPPRQYEEGKSPIQKKSMNHGCYLSGFDNLEKKLGNEVWSKLKESSLGVFLKLYEEKYIWSAQIVHYFLTNQLSLNCDPFDPLDKFDADHREFWKEMKVSTANGPTLDELKSALDICHEKGWSEEKKMMLGRLFLLQVGIYGYNHGSRIPLSFAKRVLDPESFEKYQWGRVGFTELVGSIKVVNYEGTSYTLHGCVHALFIWVFESVPGLAELYGNRRETSPGPPLLNWIGSRPRFLFRDFITDEKIEHGEVRVRHMVPVALHDMYPKWSDDDANNRDPLLHKLIEDIIEDRLDPNGWPVVERVKKQKNSLPAKKKKIKRSEQQSEDSGEEKESLPAKKKTVKISEQDSEDSGEEKESLPAKKKVKISEQDSELLTMLKTINETLANLGNQVGNIDGKVNMVDQTCKTKFAKMEEAIKQLQEGEVKGQADEVNSKTSTSWMVVETKGILQDPDDIPLKQVVKNIASVKRGRKIEEMKKVVVKKEKEVVKKHEKAKNQNIDYGSDIEDVTEKHFIEEHTMASSGDEEDIADKAVKNVVAFLHSNLLDDTTPLTKRVPKLANSQKLPYIGNSTVKRIIPGVITSLYDYDPMEMVEESKLRKLMEYINDDEEQPLGSVNTNVKFYKEIITPRDQWPKHDYGWLRDSHMDDAMTMFRKRSMRKDSPFRKRVGFMDQWFSSIMVSDFKNYNKKTFMFHESYMEHFNGTAPRHSATEKRWWLWNRSYTSSSSYPLSGLPLTRFLACLNVR
ncbi:uncharacterized protein LOC9330101 [Arabidopsis lyrata subsp. lyrata]|uniref:uncharacterized protein LOC9330101 n=1 Tax=Arabidopsis lyrata subsp. lyrata TaxID=81972 RepID=UPI000A29CB43|nr:uncharacterized protein LOC9330101 [Arabidopsis lyrata subsp. lyrata]|eukprot:XP_020866165.1 uncharacterized protein LOC9330101 [Arabidopsis lyrata subsp. lyrata]